MYANHSPADWCLQKHESGKSHRRRNRLMIALAYDAARDILFATRPDVARCECGQRRRRRTGSCSAVFGADGAVVAANVCRIWRMGLGLITNPPQRDRLLRERTAVISAVRGGKRAFSPGEFFVGLGC